MGPLLWKDNYTLYFPGNEDAPVTVDYYSSEFTGSPESNSDESLKHPAKFDNEKTAGSASAASLPEPAIPSNGDTITNDNSIGNTDGPTRGAPLKLVEPLPWAHPKRLWATVKLVFTYGITREVVAHQSRGLEDVHRRAPVYENKVEHLWTTAQVCTAMLMSIAHGANDVSNAIGPFTTEYATWNSGVTSAKTDTPTWIKAVGGLGLGFGFWTFGYHIMRSLGNRITKHTPTRGYSMELAAAITVLLASNLGLPVSTTQCITGAIIGVALTNGDLKSINWKQLGKIFFGWVLTVPCAGLVSGLIMGMALNVPHWGPRP